MNVIKTKIKAIIFDMDGTIIDTEKLWRLAQREALIDMGIEKFSQNDHDFLDAMTGKCATMISHQVKERFNLAHPAEDFLTRTATAANLHFKEKTIDFIEGFELFHQKLTDAMIPTALATNAGLENLTTLASKLNFQRFFGEHLYSREHVSKPKPAPDIFLHAAQKLGAKPDECIVFEDSEFGIQAANAAGIRCIAIKNMSNSYLMHLVQDAVNNYHEAEAALKRIM